MTIPIIYYTRRQGVPNSTNLLLCCIFLPLLFLATMPHHSFVFFERKNETSWSAAAVLCSPFLPSDVENGQQPCGSVVEFPLFGVACGLLPSTPSTWELLRHQGELITLPNKVGTFRSTQKHQEPNHHNKRRRRRGWQYQTPQSDSAQLAFLRLNNRAFHRQWPSYISARLYTRVHRKR